MSIPADELTPNDYLILKYISTFNSVSKEQILNKFSNKIESIEYRLDLLKEKAFTFSGNVRIPISESSYIEEEFTEFDSDYGKVFKTTNHFHISQLGKKTLQDYSHKMKSDKRNLWLKNAWIPILVTIATNLIINGIQWLLPLILECISNTP